MKIDLLNNEIINIGCYQEGAGWEVSTDIPEKLLNKTMKVQLESWYFDEDDECHDVTKTIEVTASNSLDDIIEEIVNNIRSFSEEEQVFYEDHCYLEELVLDTDTMVATTFFGS